MKNINAAISAICGLGTSALIYAALEASGLSMLLSIILSSVCAFFSLFLAFCFYLNSRVINLVKKVTLVSLFLSVSGVFYYAAEPNASGGYDINMTIMGYAVVSLLFIASIYKFATPITGVNK